MRSFKLEKIPAPGKQTTFNIDVIAPLTAGIYKYEFMLKESAKGRYFGPGKISFSLIVVEEK